MDFKQEFLTALRAGEGYEMLIELVRRHHSQGLSIDAAYEALEQIWLDHGFNKEDDGGAFQDNLEAVMEKVWYGYTLAG